MNATRSITGTPTGTRSTRWRVLSTVFLAFLGTMLVASPPYAAEGDLRVSCSALVPGATVDCWGYQSEPDPPRSLVVTLRTVRPPGETVLLDDPRPVSEDHEVWFSFDLPETARAGDEIRVHLLNAADAFDGHDVLVVPVWVHDPEGELWLTCSKLVPGTTIDCLARQAQPEEPLVRVTLRTVQPPGETVLFDQGHVDWPVAGPPGSGVRYGDFRFSFDLPSSARAGDEVLVQELRSVGVDLILVVPGATPAEPEPEPEPTEPSETASPEPAPEPAEPAQPPEPAPASAPAEAADATTAVEELPHTGPPMLPVVLGLGLALVGAGVAVRRRSGSGYGRSSAGPRDG
jgi:hypothetical protein